MNTSFPNHRDPASPFDLVPITGRIGAEIRGVDLCNIDAITGRAIRAALLRHKVLFFRGQRLNAAQHEHVASVLGRPIPHPTNPDDGASRYLTTLDSREIQVASSWHTDVTFLKDIPEAAVLLAETMPETGGDTLWANCATAYQDLPEELKAMVNNLWAVHDNDFDISRQYRSGEIGKLRSANFNRTIYKTRHPVVHVHPETGERSLLLGSFLKSFVNFDRSNSSRLYDLLQSYIEQPDNVVRWKWCAGDVAIWDNRTTQHRVANDFGQQHRVVRRIALAGKAPVAISGESSQSFSYAPTLTANA